MLLVSVNLRNARYPSERLPVVFEDMRHGLKALPGVLSASFSDVTPISGSSSNMPIAVEGFVGQSRMDSVAWTNRVSPGFFETFGTPVLQGRDFDAHDRGDAPMVAIVNEAFAHKFLGHANPVSRYFRTNLFKLGSPIQIVGLVKDAKYHSLREEAVPTFYTPYAQEEQFYPFTTIELRVAGTTASLIPEVKASLATANPEITLEFRTLARQVADSLSGERLLAALSGFFGSLALLLAMIGLYGVMSYSVARRIVSRAVPTRSASVWRSARIRIVCCEW